MIIIFKMLTTEKENRFEGIVAEKKPLLGIYFSAGYPYLNATGHLLKALQENKADFVEVGMPYSDPMADGPVIESCHAKALKNGMSIELMFKQLKEVKSSLSIPVVLMGYFNPVFKFGIERFCDECVASGVEALILPDMPVEQYVEHYRDIFKARNLHVVFLATPDTPAERLKLIDENSSPFIYLVSSSSTTGQTSGITDQQADNFRRVKQQVKNPLMVGFGISSHQDFNKVTTAADGAIVGSAFLKSLEGVDGEVELKKRVSSFLKMLKEGL